ncbi:hypothetical protein, partial [Serratia fonticola]|uniref:hypothetical protein n=1 Tax=Serratia fonticola TaxID=47917 RepID=UPI001C6917BC
HLSPAEQFHLLAAENIDSAMFADLSTLMRHNLMQQNLTEPKKPPGSGQYECSLTNRFMFSCHHLLY